MAQRAESHPASELESDAWSATWGDPALQNLGRRLVSYGLPDGQAALIVEQTWLFYSYVALPIVQSRLPMGIATQHGENRPVIWFYIGLQPHRTSLTHSFGRENFAALWQAFSREFARPLADQVTLRLEPFQTTTETVVWALGRLERLEEQFHQYAARHQLDYVGVFVDDLEAELRTVMDPKTVPLWLETPNVMFGGRKPAELLADPLDRQLRDVITRAKFDLPVA